MKYFIVGWIVLCLILLLLDILEFDDYETGRKKNPVVDECFEMFERDRFDRHMVTQMLILWKLITFPILPILDTIGFIKEKMGVYDK